jgi:hypothetical protein
MRGLFRAVFEKPLTVIASDERGEAISLSKRCV